MHTVCTRYAWGHRNCCAWAKRGGKGHNTCDEMRARVLHTEAVVVHEGVQGGPGTGARLQSLGEPSQGLAQVALHVHVALGLHAHQLPVERRLRHVLQRVLGHQQRLVVLRVPHAGPHVEVRDDGVGPERLGGLEDAAHVGDAGAVAGHGVPERHVELEQLLEERVLRGVHAGPCDVGHLRVLLQEAQHEAHVDAVVVPEMEPPPAELLVALLEPPGEEQHAAPEDDGVRGPGGAADPRAVQQQGRQAGVAQLLRVGLVQPVAPLAVEQGRLVVPGVERQLHPQAVDQELHAAVLDVGGVHQGDVEVAVGLDVVRGHRHGLARQHPHQPEVLGVAGAA